MKAAGYVRVSTQEQAKNGYSITEQADKIRTYCELKEWDLVETYEDPGYTGTNYDRPGLQRMLSETHRFDIVVVFRLDRLSRSQEGALHLVNDLKAKGIAFNSISENFDTSTSIGQAMLGITAAFAQLDHDTIIERMAIGKEGRAKKGLWNGGCYTPIGYTYANGRLSPNDDASHVREVFDMYVSGVPIMAIKRYSEANWGWHVYVSQITRMLKNPVYTGIVQYRGAQYPGQHERIVDDETWEQVQALYQKSLKARYDKRNPNKAKHLLVGLLYCSCGCRYHIIWSGISKQGVQYDYYACLGKRNGCKARNRKAPDLDSLILDEIRALNFADPPKRERKDNSAEIRKLERQKDRLIDLYSISGISAKSLTERIDKLNKRIRLLQQPPQISVNVPAKDKAIDILDNGTFEEQRALVNALIEKVEIDGDDIHIYWTI